MFRKSMAMILGAFFIVSSFVPSNGTIKSGDCRDDPPSWPELNGTQGNNSWYVSWVWITFNGSVNDTFFRVDDGNWTKYTKPYLLNLQGIHVLEWTCDSNMSDIYSMEIKIDWDEPILTNYTVKWISLLKWHFSVDATDELSGVNRVSFFYANVIDTEPPYEATFRGCMWLNYIIEFFCSLIGVISDYPCNVWDNAGNYIDVYPS